MRRGSAKGKVSDSLGGVVHGVKGREMKPGVETDERGVEERSEMILNKARVIVRKAVTPEPGLPTIIPITHDTKPTQPRPKRPTRKRRPDKIEVESAETRNKYPEIRESVRNDKASRIRSIKVVKDANVMHICIDFLSKKQGHE